MAALLAALPQIIIDLLILTCDPSKLHSTQTITDQLKYGCSNKIYQAENVTDNLLSTLLPFHLLKWYSHAQIILDNMWIISHTWVKRGANTIPQVEHDGFNRLVHKETKHDNYFLFFVCHLPETYTYLCPHVSTYNFRRLHTLLPIVYGTVHTYIHKKLTDIGWQTKILLLNEVIPLCIDINIFN